MVKAVIWGFGALGRAIAKAAAEVDGIEIVGAVDHAPQLAGRALADVVPGAGGRIVPALEPAAALGADILFHATTTDVETVEAELLAAVAAGYNVISGAEWLYNGWLRYGAVATAIDTAAKAAGVRVMGSGINPGLTFESLPILLLRSFTTVRYVDITRTPNVGGIGPGDYEHVGFGNDIATFERRWAAGELHGHIGFPESLAVVAEAAGLAIDRIEERLVPTLATRPVDLGFTVVEVGQIVGITQEALAFRDDVPVIRMVLDAFLDPEPYGRAIAETLRVEGSRDVTVTITPAATPVAGAAAILVRDALAMLALPAGLVSQLDLPMGGHRPTGVYEAVTNERRDGAMRITLARRGA